MESVSKQRDDKSGSTRVDVVDPTMAAALRNQSPAERLETLSRLWRHAERLLQAQLRQTHPDWSDEDRSREVARRMAHGSW